MSTTPVDPKADTDELVVDLVMAPAAPAPRQARLTVVEHIYHQPPDAGAVQHPTTFVLRTSPQEDPYRRTYTVGEQWSPITLPWEGGVALMTVANVGPLDGPVLDVGVEHQLPKRVRTMHRDPEPVVVPVGPVPPGQSVRLIPLANLRLRGLGGPVRVTVVAFPV
jgi:hypothetical protein